MSVSFTLLLCRSLGVALACSVSLLALEATAEAHVLDEYLQAAQVTITTDGPHVELRLTPGVAVADRLLAEIEHDHDGAGFETEEQSYAQHVLRDLSLQVDGRPAPLRLVAADFPPRDEMRTGVAAIRLELTATAPFNVAGEHEVTFRNDHLPDLSVYLANVLAPRTDAFVILGQTRDPRQRELTLRFSVAPAGGPELAQVLGVGLALMVVLLWATLRLTPRLSVGQHPPRGGQPAGGREGAHGADATTRAREQPDALRLARTARVLPLKAGEGPGMGATRKEDRLG